MKYLIAAIAFSTFTVSALAENRPFEQTELDRVLPEISIDRASAGSSAAPRTLPFEQIELDRAVPNVAERAQTKSAASSFPQYDAI